MNDKDVRTYIRVHDGIIDHPKVEPLSDRAFRLLLESWCWCSRHLTDGRVPLAVWKRRGSAKTRNELVNAGLVLLENDAAVMHDYLEHQRSADEVAERREAKRRAGALGNHNRWHAGKKYDPECPICLANATENESQEGSQDVSQVRSQMGSQNGRKTSPETETETETQFSSGYLREGESPTGRARETSPPPPTLRTGQRPADRCDRHHDHDDPPPCGQCADARRAAEQWDAARTAERDQLAAAIERAKRDRRQDCEHGTPGGLFIRPDTGTSATCPQCRHTERAAS